MKIGLNHILYFFKSASISKKLSWKENLLIINCYCIEIKSSTKSKLSPRLPVLTDFGALSTPWHKALAHLFCTWRDGFDRFSHQFIPAVQTAFKPG